jgi:hypothetical protein
VLCSPHGSRGGIKVDEKTGIKVAGSDSGTAEPEGQAHVQMAAHGRAAETVRRPAPYRVRGDPGFALCEAHAKVVERFVKLEPVGQHREAVEAGSRRS